MRSILILLCTIGLLVVGFFIYSSLQSSSARPEPDRARASLPLNLPPTTQSAEATVAGPGEDVWVKSYDQKTGQVAFQFRASRYTPRQDGAVDVVRPQAELFMGDEERQVVRIEGATGRVVMQTDVTQRSQIRGTESAAPRRGELHDVLISLFDESDLARPLLVCKVNNIAFDNDTFRIATEGYDDGRVPADQVPVEVRGQDFDFDGRGLTIRWNETDRRLQLLEIAHGESLTIKSPELLGGFDGAGLAENELAPAPAKQAQPRQRAEARQPSAPAKPEDPRLPPVYRAVFDQAVRVTQAQEQIALADRMLVDFVTSGTIGSQDRAESKTPPKSRSATKPAARRPEHSAPQASAPQPLVVRWIGKLRVTALEGDSPRPAPGSINVAMSAEQGPVLLDHRGMKLTCASFDYRSGDDSLSVTSSKQIPMITLEVDDGTTVRTPSIVYSHADSKATLRGAGEARIAAPADDKAPPEMLESKWTKSCELTLARGASERFSIESATLDGDVSVDHPRLALRSDRLKLGMGAPDPAGKPVLKDLTASGSVQCKLIDPERPPQDIRCDQLAAEVAPLDGGGFTLKTLAADGNVVASGDDSQLSAGHLTLALIPVKRAPGAQQAPAPQPKAPIFGGGDVELQSLRAQKDVKLKLRDGGTATADQLDVEQTPQGMVAVLLGQPTATLSDGTNTLTGPNIKFVNDSQELFVYGPGTLQFDARTQPDEPARAVQVTWNSGLAVHGRANEAQISGGVLIDSDSSDGSRQRATADRVILALADAPQPATAAVQASARDPGSEYFSAARGKTLRSITLSGNAQVQSVLEGTDESQIRRMHLLAPDIRYELESRRAEVPSAGRMLVQDTRQSPAPSESANQPLGNFRGATAFQWSKDLILDQGSNQMTMSGSVLIVHQNQGDASQSFRLAADRVIADLLPEERPAAPQTTESALLGPSDVRLKSLSAEGDIRMSASQIQVEAKSVFYDALRNLLTARGSDRVPVQVYNDEGVSRGSFAEIVWNTKTEQIERMRQVQAQVRR